MHAAARLFHGVEELAQLVHALVGQSGYVLPYVPAEALADYRLHPAPTGYVASSLAAKRMGMLSSGAGATAMREMERRHRPPAAETFSVQIEPRTIIDLDSG